MVKHNNPSITERIQQKLNLKLSDEYGEELGFLLSPVVPIEPIINVVVSPGPNVGTVFTTPTDKNFFLTDFFLTSVYDSNSQGEAGITFTLPSGKTVRLRTSHTEQSPACTNHSFRYPILIKRGTDIEADGSDTFELSICGYTEEITRN